MKKLLNINSLYHDLHTVHPLERASILHLQGCRKGRTDPCPGCANKDLWSEEPKWLVDAVELADIVIRYAAAPALSISGGEPLDQYELLCQLLETLSRAHFSILMWTGFEMKQVESDFSPILQWLDCIITGPYVEEEKLQTTPFISSRNQEVHCLTERAIKFFAPPRHAVEYELIIHKRGLGLVSLGCELPGLR